MIETIEAPTLRYYRGRMNNKKMAVSATILAASLALVTGVSPAYAVSGQLNNANIVASWEYTWTKSSASAYSKTLRHYAYAQQDTDHIAKSNAEPGIHAQAHVTGSEGNHGDYATANIGWR